MKYNYRQISSNIVKLAATKADAMIMESCSFVGYIRKWRMFVEVLTCVGMLANIVCLVSSICIRVIMWNLCSASFIAFLVWDFLVLLLEKHMICLSL